MQRTIQIQSVRDRYRWLSQESGLCTTVGPTGCMDQEGVTDEHVTGGTGGEHFATPRGREWDLRFLACVGTGQALFAGGGEQPCHLEMRAWEQAARCIVHPHVGEQAQQQQRPLLRSVVHEPAGVTRRLEARIDVPPGVPRILVAGKSHDERTQVRAGLPGIRVDQVADGVEQARSVGCPPEALPVGTPLITGRRQVSGLARSMPSCWAAERRHSSASSVGNAERTTR